MKKGRLALFSILLPILPIMALVTFLLLFILPIYVTYARTTEPPTTPPLTTTADQPTNTSELPNTVGIRLGSPNQYLMTYTGNRYDEMLGQEVMTFKPTDASKLEALLSYCCPFWKLPVELNRLQNAHQPLTVDTLSALSNVQDILNDLLINAGGGPDYRYVEYTELIQTAKTVLASESYQRLLAAVEPLTTCAQTDARSLMQNFSAEELTTICDHLRETAYGTWALRLEWLDEMEFSMPVPSTFDQWS